MGCICHTLRGRRDEEQGPLLQPTTPAAVQPTTPAAVQPTTLAAAPPTTLAAAPSLVSWCWICQYAFIRTISGFIQSNIILLPHPQQRNYRICCIVSNRDVARVRNMRQYRNRSFCAAPSIQ